MRKPAAFLRLAVFAGVQALGLAADGPTQMDLKSLRDRIDKIVHDNTVEAFVGPIQTPISLELAEFMLEHIDLSTSLVRQLKLAPYSASLRGPRQFWADDGDGSKGLVTLVDYNAGKRVYYVDGRHETPFLPTIHADAVVIFDLKPNSGPECRTSIESSFTVYVRLHSIVLSDLAKTIRPFVRKTVARKFAKGFMVAHEVGRLTGEDPGLITEKIQFLSSFSSEDRAVLMDRISRFRQAQSSCLANRK